MPLTVLGNQDVKSLLHSLNKQDILDLQQSLADALHYYSASYDDEDNGCAASYQPHRTMLQRKEGQTTLVMPACSNDAMGVKIVTLDDSHPLAQCPEKSVRSSISSATTASTTASTTDSMRSLSLSEDSSRSSTVSKGSSATQSSLSTAESFTPPQPGDGTRNTRPRGTMTLYNLSGAPRAMINAEELTAFRTALASTALFKKRKTVHDITVFGAGKQAYWHLRLALLLRGSEIHHINIINRSFERANQLIQDLIVAPEGKDLHKPKMAIVTSGHAEYERLLKSTVRAASVIFCTTPSTEPLFPPSYLTSNEGRRKGRYIAAIGSFKPHMIELHTDIIKQAVAPSHHHHHHKHAVQGGAIVVDSVDSCMKEAGEIIQAGLGAREVVELGELVMLKRDADARRQAAEQGLDAGGVEIGGGGGKKGKNSDGGLKEWLEKGNVIYKSVGLGLLDVVVGTEIVKLADQRGTGTRIQNF